MTATTARALLGLVVAFAAGATPANAQGVGAASARIGLSRDADGDLGSGSLAAEGRLVFLWGWFEMGPKVGYARLGPDASVWEPGVLARVRLGSGSWTPTVHGALSGLIYQTSVADSPLRLVDGGGFFGGEVGIGAVMVRTAGPDLSVEFAVHKILQPTGGFDPGPYWTVTVGIETSW